MILEKVLKKDLALELSKELLEKAHLQGRVNIIVGDNEITIKKVLEMAPHTHEEMIGLGKGVFNKDSVTLQRSLRREWEL